MPISRKWCLTIIFLTLLGTLGLYGCTQPSRDTDTQETTKKVDLKIVRSPGIQDFSKRDQNNKISKIKEYTKENSSRYYLDLRGRDVSHLDLSENKNELAHSEYDNTTKWPDKLPEDFDPQKILDDNKIPGLNIKKLHEQGINGKGVGIGIIDYGLLINHEEFKDNLKMYEEINYSNPSAHFHGPAVASIAAGKNVGVAPGADIYFIGCENFDNKSTGINQTYVAQSITRLLEVNQGLPKDNKIRVISISGSWDPNTKGYDDMQAAIKEAKKQGVFVVSANLFEYNSKFHFRGLRREYVDNPDDFEAYSVIEWNRWISMVSHIGEFDEFYKTKYKQQRIKNVLLIPIDAKTTASSAGESVYAYYSDGGWSWGIPYISGLYALCCQVNPDITPEKFWKAACETGIKKKIDVENGTGVGRMVNPEKLIEKVRKM